MDVTSTLPNLREHQQTYLPSLGLISGDFDLLNHRRGAWASAFFKSSPGDSNIFQSWDTYSSKYQTGVTSRDFDNPDIPYRLAWCEVVRQLQKDLENLWKWENKQKNTHYKRFLYHAEGFSAELCQIEIFSSRFKI